MISHRQYPKSYWHNQTFDQQPKTYCKILFQMPEKDNILNG